MYSTTYNVNIVPGNVPLNIHVSQYDAGTRQFEFIPYSVPGEINTAAIATVSLEATKPDGYGVVNTCTWDGSKAVYTVQQQLCAVVGNVWSKLVFRGSDSEVLGSAAIVWSVDPAGLKDSAIISDSDIAQMEEWIEEIGDATAEALKAEGFAIGEQSGTPVASGSPYYQNNSKYYSQQSAASVTSASTYATNASNSATAAAGSATAAGTSATNASNSATAAAASATQAGNYVDQAIVLGGTPLVASTAAGMTDHSKIYVYTGSETGYSAGSWYYWNGSAWAVGGVYNSTAVQTDTTLSISGMAADAKVAGDDITELKEEITEIQSDVNGVKTTTDLTSLFSKVSDLKNGATISDDIVTIPSGSTGDQTYFGIRTFTMASVKGKTLLVDIDYAFTGSDISDKLFVIIRSNGTGITEVSKSYSNGKLKATVEIPSDTTTTYVVVALKIENTAALASNTTIAITNYSAKYYDSLTTSIENLAADIVDDELSSIKTVSLTSYFSQTSSTQHGSSVSGSVLTVPSGETGNQDYIGVRVMADIAMVKGKTFTAVVNYTLSPGLSLSNTAKNVGSNGTGTTINSSNWDGEKLTANVTVANNATSSWILFAVKINTTTAFSQAVTLTLGDFSITEDVSLRNGIANVTGSGRFYGKKMSCFGDSYTSQEGWQPTAKTILGLDSYANVAIYGGVLTTGYAGITNVDTSSNILTIWYGTNDYSNNQPIGTIDDDATTPTTFYGALKYVFEWVSANIPTCLIVPITHTQRWASTADVQFISDNGYGTDGQPKNNLGFSLADYANAIIDVASRYGYKTLDFNRCGQVNKNNEGSFYGSDHLHPTAKSYTLLGHKIAKFIQQE